MMQDAWGNYTPGLVSVALTVTVVPGGAAQELFVGDGSPEGVVTPSSSVAKYIQRDSVPAGLEYNYYDGAWH